MSICTSPMMTGPGHLGSDGHYVALSGSMNGKQISAAEVQAYRALVPTVWKTAAQVAAEAGIAGRTSRLHLARLADLGLAERAVVFNGYRYRRLERPDLRSAEHLAALHRAAEVFGLEI